MRRRSILLITLFVSGFLLVGWARANQEQPKLRASLSVNRPLFYAGGTKELSVYFTLVNDGSKTIDPKIDSSKIIINGVELKDSGFIFGNGPRDKRWRALPPGDSLEFTYALEKYFREPGTYRVSWKGENFETPTIEFQIFAGAQDLTLKDTTESKYKVGQMWSYKTRPGEEKSYFIVVKVETHAKLGTIVHIAVRKLKLKNRRSPDGLTENVNHIPFSEEALNRSAVRVLKEKVDLPDFEEGYQEWREAFVAGRAGIYTITLADVATVMETTLNQ